MPIKRRARTALGRLPDRLITFVKRMRGLSSPFSFAYSLPLLVLSFFPSGVGDVEFPRENHISTVYPSFCLERQREDDHQNERAVSKDGTKTTFGSSSTKVGVRRRRTFDDVYDDVY